MSTEETKPEIESKDPGSNQEEQTETNESPESTTPENGSQQIEPAEKPGRVVLLKDIVEEKEYPDEEIEVLTKLYEKTITEIDEGEIVKGKILSINDKEVAVDIGFKSEGVISISEFRNTGDLEIGDEIDIFLDKLEDSDGQLILSKEKADFTKIWEEIVQKFESGDLIEGRVSRRIKGGMVVDLMGIDAFLPGSQIDVKPVRDFDGMIGQTFEFKIVKVNHLRKNIVVSRRVIIEEGLSEQREKMLKDLEKGQVRLGMVKNITDFGVFIDLGGVDGLLHITDLSWGRVAHPSEIVSLDQKLEVVVLDFDRIKQRVSLGLKQLQPHPWENVDKKYPVGEKINGKVVSITDYGAFIELEKGIEGLIHISEMSWTQHIKHPSKILSIGEQVEAVVLNFDKDGKKISLGLKQIEPDPWSNVVEKYPVGSTNKGLVRNVTNFGVFVELEEGIDGLVHISDLSWTKKVRHPSEIVKKGEEIEVVILNVSTDDRRISLGHKQLESNPWEAFEVEFQKGVVTTGKIVRSVEKGIIVELPGGVEGFVPSSHLEYAGEGDKNLKQKTAPGIEVKLKVIEFDRENKKIVLSLSEYLKDLEEKDVREYLEKQNKQEVEQKEEAEPVEDKKQEDTVSTETETETADHPVEEETAAESTDEAEAAAESQDAEVEQKTDIDSSASVEESTETADAVGEETAETKEKETEDVVEKEKKAKKKVKKETKAKKKTTVAKKKTTTTKKTKAAKDKEPEEKSEKDEN
ncbi:30S ribosomal protein S1 [candidate division KSB1 bacterium]|nr:30S ribosomal protein S1 [candidate division KSB1 bacterium]